MSVNRDKELDQDTTKLILMGSAPETHYNQIKGINWLGHRLDSDAHKLDLALLEGATLPELKKIRGAVHEHVQHLENEHGILCKKTGEMIAINRKQK